MPDVHRAEPAPVSIKDIARAAGLSHSTVSRALRNNPIISRQTRERVQKLARDLNYVPDAGARGLVLRHTRTVGIVVTSIADPFTAELIQEIEIAAYESGITIILASSGAEPARELDAVLMLRSKRVDGVIVTSSRLGALYREHLHRAGVPIVLINSHSERSGPYAHSVSVDNFHGGYTATRHLAGLAHARIAYIGGPEGHSSSEGRADGYRQALRDSGLPCNPALIVEGDERIEGGERAAAALLGCPDPPTAVFCYNDATALGVLRTCASRGRSVPGDLSVVGFDDIEAARCVVPSLTTIAQPKADIGRQSMRMLLALAGRQKPPEGGLSDVVLRGRLVVRESTGRKRQ